MPFPGKRLGQEAHTRRETCPYYPRENLWPDSPSSCTQYNLEPSVSHPDRQKTMKIIEKNKIINRLTCHYGRRGKVCLTDDYQL